MKPWGLKGMSETEKAAYRKTYLRSRYERKKAENPNWIRECNQRRKLQTTPEQRSAYHKRHYYKKKADDPLYHYRKSLRWRSRNPDKARAIHTMARRKMRATNPQIKIKDCLSNRLRGAMLRQNCVKPARIMELVGCSMGELRTHLESLFKDGMCWQNRGRGGWEIDHKHPCASFDLTDPIQVRACFHYTNLQPLWWYENLKKGSRVVT